MSAAQETRGNIAGTVKELTINETGYFEAPLLRPATEISVEMTGFKLVCTGRNKGWRRRRPSKFRTATRGDTMANGQAGIAVVVE